ncbi:multicopper oxidase domain-containing protein [Streptantibioticus rubrisoli]|uniref:Multicopper oxidase domain-containing protein n=1 Tax=Streptantibioticus rubrisoli TaxID=1387313 RepID=A0ABT1P7Y1_9ACTN|nr:multicopper oxidase domain-containing protein [Streptantibioticus rubrisoli]MCQ4041481.1 multicopper oxidase domain-containing protein [Streptantibioticus rubrisoli]
MPGERPTRTYEVVALNVPIAYNGFGDHDVHGALYTLAQDAEVLREVAERWPSPFPDYLKDPDLVPKPHPLARPLVLRVRRGERLRVRLTNELSRPTGMTMQGVQYDARTQDGLAAGANPDTSVAPGGTREYEWVCEHEGVFHFGDMADARGEGAQSHGLIGALVVEPPEATWTEPETGSDLASGLYADVHLPDRSFREFVIFMMEYPSNDNPADIAGALAAGGMGGMSGTGGTGGTGGMGDMGAMPMAAAPSALPTAGRAAALPDGASEAVAAAGRAPDAADTLADLTPPNNAMLPVNLRIEPMEWRMYEYMRMMRDGVLDPVRDAQTGEELHHSSWMFGDPYTPVLRGYQNDPTVIRLVHGGMRDTHVFHTHLHQWRVDTGDGGSRIVDSVSISPQEGMTLELIGGLGSVQGAVGDSLWHCHMYVHFHMGMWGMFRIFDTLQDGSGTYPDGTPIAALRPLPHRPLPALPTPERPGFPAFLRDTAKYPQKNPRPPRTPQQPLGMGREPTPLEAAAFIDDPRPGEAFTRIGPRDAPVRRYHLVVAEGTVYYHGDPADEQAMTWHDHRGHFFALAEEIEQAGGLPEFQRQLEAGERRLEPLVIRGHRGEVLELTLTNMLPTGKQAQTAFDPALPFQPECSLHTHLVKYDPLISDGSAIGWNYISGTTTADQGEQAYDQYNSWTYRWYLDEELGTILFHDHLLANYRQRHGLFGVMVAEAEGTEWLSPADGTTELRRGSEAVLRLPDGERLREFVLTVADFVPLVEHMGGQPGAPINPPPVPGGPDDQGVFGVNYRCEPLVSRGGDPADWFSSTVHGDPGTPLLRAYPGERIRLHIVQGSHDLQHSFNINGLRWRDQGAGSGAPWQYQRTFGISNAADLELDPARGAGDYLWSFGATDDLWLGAWGLVRLHDRIRPDLPPLPSAVPGLQPLPPRERVRRYTVYARAREIDYSASRIDPYGLVYEVDGEPVDGPLVLRCRAGEWVEVTLVNELDGPPPASPLDPTLLAKDDPGSRTISGRVSLHPNRLSYDVRADDGACVGQNADSTVKPGGSYTYSWYAGEPGVALLRDQADVVTHMRRGLVGALVVEEADATPYDPDSGRERWVGEQAVVRRLDAEPVHELVLVPQDGLRLYHDGDLTQPVTDLFSDSRDDNGQKAYNYRTAALHPLHPVLADPQPPTPLLHCRAGDQVAVHLVIGGARSRNQMFTVHGQVWDSSGVGEGPWLSTIGALAAGSTRSIRFRANFPGDYVYRTGNLHWGVSEGWWGLIRVDERS